MKITEPSHQTRLGNFEADWCVERKSESNFKKKEYSILKYFRLHINPKQKSPVAFKFLI